MLRALRLFLIMILSLLCVFAINKRPLFSDYSNQFCLYLQSNSSNCVFKMVDKIEYFFCLNVFGEGCIVQKENFNIDKFLEVFSAEIVAIEQGEEGISVYAYSKNIKYLQTIKGKKVNLHVAIGKEQVFLGSPIIYGSF